MDLLSLLHCNGASLHQQELQGGFRDGTGCAEAEMPQDEGPGLSVLTGLRVTGATQEAPSKSNRQRITEEAVNSPLNSPSHAEQLRYSLNAYCAAAIVSASKEQRMRQTHSPHSESLSHERHVTTELQLLN